MPLYNYRCEKCKKTFEVQLSYAEFERAKIACPKCKSKRVKRQIEGALSKRGKSNYRLTREQVDAAIGLTNAALASDHDPAEQDHSPESS